MPDKQQSQPTQKFIDVEEVKENTLVLKNGGLRQIVMVSGLNFDLKSEDERGLITSAYQNFLNSLNFSLQILVHSRRLNIEDYLKRLNDLENKETNELLKNQLVGYRDFVQSFVSQNPIMEKTFFVVIPFDPIQVPRAGAAIIETISGLFKKKSSAPSTEDADKNFQRHLQQLGQRADQVIAGLNGIGLRAVSLNNEEIVELLYNLYNPESVEKKTLNLPQ